jgi:hypothetical protein
MAAIVQGLERQIVVLDVVGSIPTSRPTFFLTLPKSRFSNYCEPFTYFSGALR